MDDTDAVRAPEHEGRSPELSADTVAALRCPVCGFAVQRQDEHLVCISRDCGARFPIIEDVPVLIRQDHSLFSAAQIREGPGSFDRSTQPSWTSWMRRFTPALERNLCADRIMRELARRLDERPGKPRVLVVGGGTAGEGIEWLANDKHIELVESDVYLSPRTAILLDAHDIPFESETFDALIAQAVLEHVIEPHRCVEEFARVLKPGGLVYAGTPFMQQVHGGAYDFTRFSHLGHRRLFRRFEEVESGMVLGPGTALAWSWTYFLASFCRTPRSRAAAHLVGRFTGFFWKSFDPYLARRSGAIDAASAVYFFGSKAPTDWILSDQDLIKSYRGIHG